MADKEIACILNQILKELKIIKDKVVSRTNAHFIISFDTSANTVIAKKIDIRKDFGIPHANDLTIIDVGGGFTIAKNGESPAITATTDLTFEDEDIYSIELIGSGTAGTAIIRVGAYQEKG